MSEGGEGGGPIDVPVTSSGADGVERIVTALDRLYESLQSLGNVSGLTRLEQQVQVMQASMTTGFANLAAEAQKGENRIAQAAEEGSNKVLSIHQRRDVEVNRLRGQAMSEYVGWWDKMLSIEESRETELNRMRQKATQEYTTWWEKAAAERAAIEQRRDTERNAMQQKAAAEYVGWWEKAAAERIETEQRRDVELNAMRARELADSIRWWEKTLVAQEAAAAKQIAVAEAAAERQRVLNTSFMTSGPAAQIRQAVQAETYLQQPGATRAGAVERYGSVAVASDVDALRAAHAALTPAVNGSQGAVEAHNHAMAEAHSLARGLAGSLGGLWLTYGSLVPLAAGAAIAGALRQVVVVGSEVEHQLTNVLALTNSGVNLDQFLRVSDGSLHSLAEGANAMRMLAQNGLNASQSLQILPSILDLATVGEMTVGQAALAATGAASAFGLGYAEAGRVADIFARTAANSNTSVLAMTESMRQASTVASLFHVSIEETAGMLGLLAKINVTGGAAGTSLTNMLTGLYEPTEKGKKALKELRLETQTASGELKPLTQLLDEAKGKLAGFNDAARVDILGSIFTVRGVKSAELALTNLDEFKKKTEEAASASGFMADVVKKLEDDTTGGFQRMGVTVQNSFVRAFAEASPYVQHIALTLTDAFKDGGSASTGLQNFATNVARLTGTLVDNLGTVTLLGAGYVGLRALGPVIELVQAATAASVALTAAQTAETVAMGALTAANIAGASTAAEVTAVTTAQTVATEAATAAMLAWEATLLPVLGAVGVAVGLAAAAWLLFRDNTDGADTANQKITNSLHVVEEALEREIKQLEKANALWDAKNGKYHAPETVAPGTLDAARVQVGKLEGEARRRGLSPDDLRDSSGGGVDAGSGVVVAASGYDALAEALTTADENLRKLEATQKRVEQVLDPAKAVRSVHDATAQLREELEKFAKSGSEVNSKGDFYQQNAAVRAVHLQASTLRDQLLDPGQVNASAEAEQARITALRTDLKQLQDQRNALLMPRAEKEDKKAAADAYRAAVQGLDDDLEQIRKKAQTAERDIASAYKTGAVSAVAAAQQEHDVQVKALNEAIDIANQKKTLAGGKEHGLGDAAKFEKEANAARAGVREADAKLDRDYNEIVRASAAEATQFRIDEAKREGNTALAYRLANAVKIAQIDRGLEDSYSVLINAMVSGDAKAVEKAMALVTALENAKQRSDAAIGAAVNADAVAHAEKQFGALFATLNAGLASVKASAGTDPLSMFDSAAREAQLYSDMLPQLIAKQKELADIVKNGRPEDQKKAATELTQLEAAAERARNVWVDVSKSIGKGLADAFGQGGKALGDLLIVSLSYGARQQKIAEDLQKAGGTPEAKERAARDTASAQVHAYGDMAQAAAGFFGKQSKGYQTLMAVSQAYHAAELAMTVAELVPKAISAVLTQGQGEPYTAFGRMAAMAALVAGLGVALSGGGGADHSAADRQKAQGTGSVLGAPDAKSNSIAHAVELSAANSNILINYTAAMAASLHSIESNIGSFASQVVKSTGLNGTTAPDYTSFSGKGVALAGAVDWGIGGAMIGSFFGPLGTALGAVLGAALGHTFVGKILSSVFGGSSTVTDTGLTMAPMSLQNINSNGANAAQYTDVKTDGGWFRGDSHDTRLGMLSADTNAQFTLVIKSLADGVTEASKLLGICDDAFLTQLNGFVVDIGNVSLKDLSGDQIQKELEAVFSKVGDDMASYAVPAISQFAKVGEGALETLTRVAADYANLNAILQSTGMSFGATGLASIAAREHLIDMAGGIDKLASQASTFATNFLTKGEQMAPVAKYVNEQLAAMNLGWVDTRVEFKNVVQGLDLTTDSGQQTYVALMALQDAFAKTHAAATDLTKTEQEIADERKNWQDQLDQLTMTHTQLLKKQRDALDESNRALFDQVQLLGRSQDYITAGATLRDSLRSLGDTVQGLHDKVVSTAAGVKTAQDAISQAYFKAQDDAVAAQQKITDMMLAFSGSIRDFLATLATDPTVGSVSGADAMANLKAQFSSTAVLAQGGDKKSQDALIGIAGKLEAAYRASSGSSLEFATREASLKHALAAVAGSTEAAAGAPSDDPMVAAQKELLAAQNRMVELAALAAVTGASTDRAAQVTADSTAGLLKAYNDSVTANLAARDTYASALTLTSNLMLTTTNALSGLVDGLQKVSQAQTQFLGARNDLAKYVVDTETSSNNLGQFADNLANQLGLTGQAAAVLKQSLTDPTTAVETLSELLGTGANKVGSSADELVKALGLSGAEADSFKERLGGTQGALLEVVAALGGTGTAAEQLAAQLGPQLLSAQAQTLATSLQLAADAAQALAGIIHQMQAGPTQGDLGPAPVPVTNDSVTRAALTQAYQDALGRAPDAGGLQYWMDQVAAGKLTLGTAAQNIALSAATSPNAAGTPDQMAADAYGGTAWLHAHRVPGFALGGNFGGGLRMVGEDGPELEATGPSRIWNAADTRSMLGGGSAALEAEVARLTKTVEKLQAALDKIAISTDKTATSTDKTQKVLTQVTDGGEGMKNQKEAV